MNSGTKTVSGELTLEELTELLQALGEHRSRLLELARLRTVTRGTGHWDPQKLEHRAELCFQVLTKLGVFWSP